MWYALAFVAGFVLAAAPLIRYYERRIKRAATLIKNLEIEADALADELSDLVTETPLGSRDRRLAGKARRNERKQAQRLTHLKLVTQGTEPKSFDDYCASYPELDGVDIAHLSVDAVGTE
jgi:hypothetical protein